MDRMHTRAGFDPGQPRDDDGKWSDTGGGGGSATGGFGFTSEPRAKDRIVNVFPHPTDRETRSKFSPLEDEAVKAYRAGKAEEKDVRLDDLYSLQQDIYPPATRDKGPASRNPLVMSYQGALIIVDGNHRLAAAKMRGDKTAKADVVTVTGGDGDQKSISRQISRRPCSMDRAYSLLTVKRVSEDERIIEGIATTITADRMGDVVEPKGATFRLPLPLLWQHDPSQPVGHVTHAEVTDKGIAVKARFVRINEPGKLKDRLDEAWQAVKHGLVQGLSIGFSAEERSYIGDTYGMRFSRWNWHELSLVTIPANAEASITTVRSLVDQAASGRPTAPHSGAPEQTERIKPVILREPVRVHPVRVIIPGKEAR
jgi:HK97 family phage prohead protease